MIDHKVTCDGCGRDITYTGNCEDWRIVLASESTPSNTQIVTLMHIPKPIPTTLHFCNRKCLKEVVAKLSDFY